MNIENATKSEIFIGLVGSVGIDLNRIYELISEKLAHFEYKTHNFKISNQVISKLIPCPENITEFQKINHLMDAGNKLRSTKYSALADFTALEIIKIREDKAPINQSYIINSLKHPEEVNTLRKLYSNGFFLISVYSDKELRKQTLITRKNMSEDEAEILIDRDASEIIKNGQQTTDAFHLADFFIEVNGDETYLINQISRIFDLIFGNPFITPTFDEYAMYMAFASSLRSADLSRQVGAVIVKDTAILSTGANDVPKFGGGVYWPYFSEHDKKIIDFPDGRDFLRGEDSNTITKIEIIEEIISKLPDDVKNKFQENEIESLKQHLKSSRLKDITEYGRVVHAEMDAILNCARSNTNTYGTELFCTTFPCHNCAKHIVASGIKRVVYIEPYPKSKALTFHEDTITLKSNKSEYDKVTFEPFVGVGPRSFFNLFSLNFGSGYTLTRKDNDGKTKPWDYRKASPRVPLLPLSYLDKEKRVAQETAKILEILENKNG